MIDEAAIIGETKAAILRQARLRYPFECCGVIIAKGQHQEAVECANASADPRHNYRMQGDDLAAAEDKGEVLATYHSHCAEPPVPSPADKTSAEKNKLPCLIVSIPAESWGFYAPSGWRAELVGRPFVHGVLDCYSLVQDYYQQELGIELPDYDRPDRWWLDQPELDLYMKNFEEAGFVPVGDLQKHDVILMQLKATVTNHAGVYIGDGIMIHHPPDRLSARMPYVADRGFYALATTAFVRHKSYVNGNQT